jgi:hemoglobin-like flavoprotein
MTTEDIKIVKRTWRLLQQVDPVLLGDVFYSRLFLKDSALEAMFKTDKEAQAKKLVDMLDTIVTKLNRLHELSDDIAALARRHVGYGVVASHYDKVGSALLWTLQAGLGKDWQPAVERAWSNCYAALTKTILASVESPVEEDPAQSSRL